MQDADLGSDDEFRRRVFAAETQDARRARDRVGHVRDLRPAFGVRDDQRAGVLRARRLDVLGQDAFVRRTKAVPQNQFAPQFFRHVSAEVAIGNENDFLVRGVFRHHLDGVGRRAADVAHRLDRRRRVDVGDHLRAGVLLFERRQLARGDHVGHWAAGVGVGHEDLFVGREDRGGFGHEMHAAKDDDLSVGRGGLAREAEAVADVIADVLDLAALVVVHQDDGVALTAEFIDALEDFVVHWRYILHKVQLAPIRGPGLF